MPPLPRAVSHAVVAGGCAVGLLAGCTTQPAVNRRPHQGSASATLVNSVQQITVRAGDTYRFDPSTITVRPGTVRLILVNDGKGAPHDWSLIGVPGAAVPLTAAGHAKAFSFTAPVPGSYRFVCTIHQRQGQTGTLVVLPS